MKRIVKRISEPVDVLKSEWYQEIGIRSHGRGLFHKEPVKGESIGNKRVFWVKEDMFIVNIVFAWEQAVAKTTEDEIGMIASHRFPMYEPKANISDLDYILYFFLTKKGKHLLGLASPGGAGRNKTLGQKAFEKLKLSIPPYKEQQKIASFLTAVDTKIQQLTQKKALLEDYKKGVMQQIFKQEIRFKNEEGKDYPDWEEWKLGEVCEVSKGKQLNRSELKETGEYPALNGGINPSGYTNSWNTNKNTITISEGGNSCGYVNFNKYKFWCGGHCYALLNLDSNVTTMFLFQYLKYHQKQIMRLRVGSGLPNIQKKDVIKVKIRVPSIPEQNSINEFLFVLDSKIDSLDMKIDKSKAFKKGLLQKMFV